MGFIPVNGNYWDWRPGLFGSIAYTCFWLYTKIHDIRITYIDPIPLFGGISYFLQYIEGGLVDAASYLNDLQWDWDNVYDYVLEIGAQIGGIFSPSTWLYYLAQWTGVGSAYSGSWGDLLSAILWKYFYTLYHIWVDARGYFCWYVGDWLGVGTEWRSDWYTLFAGIVYARARPLYDFWADPSGFLRWNVGEWLGIDSWRRGDWITLIDSIVSKYFYSLYVLWCNPYDALLDWIGEAFALPSSYRGSWLLLLVGIVYTYARPLYDVWENPKETITDWFIETVKDNLATWGEKALSVAGEILNYVW